MMKFRGQALYSKLQFCDDYAKARFCIGAKIQPVRRAPQSVRGIVDEIAVYRSTDDAIVLSRGKRLATNGPRPLEIARIIEAAREDPATHVSPDCRIRLWEQVLLSFRVFASASGFSFLDNA